MRPANTVQIDTHATATLRYIRASMDAAASMALPRSAGMAVGAIGLVAMGLSLLPSLSAHWLVVWLAGAAVAATAGSALLLRPSSLLGLRLTTPIRRFATCLCPSLFAGALLTAVLLARGELHSIPGTWLLLYGCALIAASVPTTAMIAVMGAAFVVLAIFAFLLPATLHTILLGLGFGGLHMLFGILIGRSRHGREI